MRLILSIIFFTVLSMTCPLFCQDDLDEENETEEVPHITDKPDPIAGQTQDSDETDDDSSESSASSETDEETTKEESAEESTDESAESKEPQEDIATTSTEQKASQAPTSQEQDATTQQTEQEPVVVPPIRGIDTVSLDEPRGNWLFKRVWWERAEQKYEKIRHAVEQVIDSRMTFFKQRSEVDKDVLDPFYLEIGFGQGELQTIVDDLIKYLEKQRENEGALNQRERDILAMLMNEKKSLEQLKRDIVVVKKLDIDLDSSLNKLLEQINRVRSYERDAWLQFKNIARVLSDVQARDLFFRMDVASSNISEIKEYIEDAFKDHFDYVINMIRVHTERIKGSVQLLKEKGIDLKTKVEHFGGESKAATDQLTDESEEEEEEDEPMGLVATVLHTIQAGFALIWDVIAWPYRYLFGSQDVAEDQDDEQEDEAADSATET